MKKIIILFALFMCSAHLAFAENSEIVNAVSTIHSDVTSVVDSTYHDVKSAVGTVYDDAKSFAKDIYPDVKSAIVSIAKGIGVAAEHVYGVLVKQFVVKAANELLLFIFSLIVLITGIVTLTKYVKQNKTITWKILLPILCSVIGFFMLIAVDFNEMFTGLINPEYGAINYILEYSRGLTKTL